MKSKKKNLEFELLGNDFSLAQIEKWYQEEQAYHDQFEGGRGEEYWSIYEVFNRKYAIDKYVRLEEETKVLSFGCAEGADTAKLKEKYNFILYGIEASDALIEAFRNRYPDAVVKKATVEGKVNFPSSFFDYIFVFGVLHHIPNVSYVLNELHRVLKERGILIVREPISWMYTGESRSEGLSPNERGIPKKFFIREFRRIGFKILKTNYAYYRPLMHIARKFPFFSKHPNLTYYLDYMLCHLPHTNSYYTRNLLDRFAPGSAYYVIQK